MSPAPTMGRPQLTVLAGGQESRPTTGREVLREIVAVLDEKLPLMRPADPSLPPLRDLRDALHAQGMCP